MVLAFGGLSCGDFAAQGASVLSYHNDNVSSGVNSSEMILTPASLTVSNFSKLYSTLVDGQIYAQPLYVPGVTITGGTQAGTHNLVIAATQHDSLYAIDAETGIIVWQTSFLTSGLPGATTITSMPAADTGSSDTAPEIGICSTPVIDGATNLLYVTAKTKQIINGATSTPNYVYTLYKIDITNGNATPNANIVSSMVIGDTAYDGSNYTFRTNTDPTAAQDPFVYGTGDGAITINGKSRVYFNAMREMNRPGLLLYNGTIYVAFGSHGDQSPYHGWLLGFDKSTLAVNAVCNLTPNGGLGGIWSSGGGPVVDANGYIYVMTGNGTFDGNNSSGVVTGLNAQNMPMNGDYGDSFVKLATDSTTSANNQNINGWGLKVVDYFAPFNNQTLSNNDTDLGSGGCTLLPDSAGSTVHPHLMVGAGKQGNIYLVDRDSMGKYGLTDNVVQSQVAIGGSFGTPAFFNGVLYYAGAYDSGKAFTIANATMSTAPVTTPDSFAWPGSTPSVSANGATNGVVWTLDRGSNELRAYAAGAFGTEIWTSALAPYNRDQLGTVTKFAVPTVVDGQVFVGTTTALVAYGAPVPPSGPPAAPTALAATTISGLEIDLSWTDNSNNEAGFTIEQSSDGIHFAQIGTVGANVTSYPVITNLQVNTAYYFRVRAFNAYETLSYSAYTNTASATTFPQAPLLNFSSGFAGSTTSLQYNGTAAIVNNRAELTNGGGYEAGTVWSQSVQNIQNFSTQFTFQLTNPGADGITFAIQNNNSTIVGAVGGALAYQGIGNSVAIKFDLYDNSGEGINSTGIYVNGAFPDVPANDLTGTGIDLHSGDVFLVSLTYDGTTLTEKITDTATAATVTYTYVINIPTTIGSNTAYIGFTGGTGGATVTADVLTWNYSLLPSPAAPVITSSAPPATGTAGVAYSFNHTATGFPIPTFSVTAGSLPNGLVLSSAGGLTGTPTTPGLYTGTIQASNGVSPVATQNFSITVYSSYASWVSEYTLTGNQALPTAVVASDGISNLMKYALGLNPFTIYNPGSTSLPAVQIKNVSGTNYLTLTFTGEDTDVTYTVQASSDLMNWTTIKTFSGNPPPGTVTVQDAQAVSASAKRYMRLQVSQ